MMKRILLSTLMLVISGAFMSVKCQTATEGNGSLNRISKKEVVEKQRVTSRDAGDKAAIEARRANANKVNSNGQKPSRSGHVARSVQIENGTWKEGSNPAKPVTAEQTEKAKQQQEARKLQKANYISSKTAIEPSTEEREQKRKTATRNGSKK